MQCGLDAGLDFGAGGEGIAEEFFELLENGLRVGDEGGVVDFEHLNAVAFFQHLADVAAVMLLRFDEVLLLGFRHLALPCLASMAHWESTTCATGRTM